MVEIFKTNVSNEELADRVIRSLSASFPHIRFNFDLDDCDRILRAEPRQSAIDITAIQNALANFSLMCEVLD